MSEFDNACAANLKKVLAEQWPDEGVKTRSRRLALAIDVAENTVDNWIMSRTLPNYDTIADIADALNIGVAELFSYRKGE